MMKAMNILHQSSKYSCLFNSGIKSLAESIKKALFPDKCLTCGEFFYFEKEVKPETALFNGIPGIIFQNLLKPFLCSTCSKDYLPVASPLCSTCGFMFKSRLGENHVCGKCMISRKNFFSARAAGTYDKTLMTLVHAFKYRGKLQLANPLGRLLFDAFIRFFSTENIDIIVPVPLHSYKFRERGFNQSILLIREWPRLIENNGLQIKPFTIDPHSLIRTRHTDSQAGLGREMRITNIRGAFSLRDRSIVKGRKILLVDDVYTTGATVDECAGVMLKEGASQVDVLTLARAM